MNSSRLARLLALLLLVTALPLAAQDPRLVERFPAAVASRLAAIVDSAGRDGLPTEPLVLRALEGQAKGASADQITAAVSRLRNVLSTARTALSGSASPIELTTAAAALQAGMPQARLAELRKLRGNLTVTVPLNAYLDLTARGAPADGTWNRISDLMRRRAGDAEFVRLTPSDIGHDAKSIGPATGPSGKDPS